MVNCRRRNALRIGELDEDLSAKDYDQGKKDNGMNQAMNAYSSDLRIIKSKRNDCEVDPHLFAAIETSKCKECNMRYLCEEKQGCHCTKPGPKCGCRKLNKGRLPL